MNLSKNNSSINQKENEIILINDEAEEDLYNKEVKLNANDSVNQSISNNQSEVNESQTKNRANITSEIFQSRINSKLFLEAIWKYEIPNSYLNFSFQEPRIGKEERTQMPIWFSVKYSEKNYIDIYFQINNTDNNFPPEVKENDIIYSMGLKDSNQEKIKENGINSNENKENMNSAPRWNECIVDLTQDQEMYEDVNGLYMPSSVNQSNTNEYSSQIKIFIVGYCFGKYDIELNPSETKAMRLMFTDTLIKDIKNDKVNISIIIEVNISKIYSNERQQVNYSGLVNEGTTCYMNSLLQILYMLGYFKRSIFQVKISPHQYKTSKIYSMQKLFYDLMCSDNKPISTHHLIVSFGWSRDQMLIQQDVQEFFIILAEIMEKELKGTKEENTFKHLFEGKIMNQIKCTEVNFESKTEEKFTDLQLTIKNCNNIYDSFDKYTEEELLTENDQYDTNTHGKQDAKKKIIFSSLPRVLILQLKRFEYNAKLNNIEKINDRFEYYDTLNLKKYTLSDKEDMPSEYECHAVIVHVGLINNGHYYCYIQPEEKGYWIKFNDEKVSTVEPYEVFNNNYGGNTIHYVHTNTDNITKDIKMNFSNAYLLIYIRKDCLNEILVKIAKEDIPNEMITVFNLEKEEKEREQMISFRKTFFMNIDIISKEIIENSNTNNRITGLTESIIESNDILSYNRRIRVNAHQDMLIDTFISLISQIAQIPKPNLFLYKYGMVKGSYLDRYNYQMKCLTDDLYKKRLIELTTSIEPVTQYYNIYIHTDTNTPLFCYNKTSIALGKDKEIKYALNSDASNNPNNNEDITSILFYNPKENNWELNMNNLKEYPLSQSVNINPIREKKILVFIKSPKISIDCHNEISIEMKLEQVYQVKPKDTLNSISPKYYFNNILRNNLSSEFKEMIQEIYDNAGIQYLIEYSSLNNFPLKDTTNFLPNFNGKCNQTFEIYNNDAICVLLSLKPKTETNENFPFKSIRHLITDRAIKELTQADVEFICSTDNSDININTELNIPSMHIDLKTSKESIQKLVIPLIKESLFPKLFGYKTMPINDPDIKFKVFMQKEEKTLIDLFIDANYKIIQLCPFKHNQKKNYYSNYPLLEYVWPTNQIKFKINLDNLLNKASSSFYKILICDEYSNPTTCAYFEREIHLPPRMEVIIRDYIIHNDDLYLYYFVPFNPFTLIAYDILPSLPVNKVDIYNTSRSRTEMRYQPHPKRPMSETKIFICAYLNKVTPLLLPFFLYCNIQRDTIKEMKDSILNIINHNKEFTAFNEDSTKLKFYKCNLNDFKPINFSLIDSKMDNQKLFESLSPTKVNNICIDLTTKSKDIINGSNGNKNYLFINE